jgi:lysophospholipase L1-like esterase
VVQNFYKMKTCIKILFVLLLSIGTTYAQQQYAKEIHAFKIQDSITTPPANPILFIGSSSFTIWKDVGKYFPEHTIVNRGFGGSRLIDVIHYASDVIYPYNPKQVVIYAGENDIAYSDSVTSEMVLNRVKSLFYLLRGMYPDISIVYVSIKPSVARQEMMPRMEAANKMIKKFLSNEKNAAFVNVYDKMLLPNGKPDPAIFKEDNLHMNAKGYDIWKKALEPYLNH